AERYNKPIVIEKLDTTQSKTGDRYGNKRANRMKRLDIRTHHFYQLYDVDQPKEVLQIERLPLFENEKKKLAKRFA
ncbi:hypothetical protein COM57_29760, partial [Bacillus pseudomycoides]